MNEREEREIRNALRTARVMAQGLANDSDIIARERVAIGLTAEHTQRVGMRIMERIDRVCDALDAMREREEVSRAAWRRSMREEAEELFAP